MGAHTNIHTHTACNSFERLSASISRGGGGGGGLLRRRAEKVDTDQPESECVCASVLGVVDTNAARQMPQWLAKTLFARRLMRYSVPLFCQPN
jgi:hypothetical protein